MNAFYKNAFHLFSAQQVILEFYYKWVLFSLLSSVKENLSKFLSMVIDHML